MANCKRRYKKSWGQPSPASRKVLFVCIYIAFFLFDTQDTVII
jgi:hypothetical protein